MTYYLQKGEAVEEITDKRIIHNIDEFTSYHRGKLDTKYAYVLNQLEHDIHLRPVKQDRKSIVFIDVTPERKLSKALKGVRETE